MATILVVDDSRDICELIEYKLSRAGHDVHVAFDGEAGLAKASILRPDLVVLDWMMPRLTGLEVCQQLRATAHTACIPIVMLTAKAQEGDVERGFAAGATDFVSKPFSPKELALRIDGLLTCDKPTLPSPPASSDVA